MLFVLPGIALLLADAGEAERAIELYAQIAEIPVVANSTMRWDLAGAQLASVAATLPAEIVRAARARVSRGHVGHRGSFAGGIGSTRVGRGITLYDLL
ncbi:MAG: hypothetical protein R2867_37205 [Caldilineaceae bacterium]